MPDGSFFTQNVEKYGPAFAMKGALLVGVVLQRDGQGTNSRLWSAASAQHSIQILYVKVFSFMQCHKLTAGRFPAGSLRLRRNLPCLHEGTLLCGFREM